jgi:hypothetical protein
MDELDQEELDQEESKPLTVDWTNKSYSHYTQRAWQTF